MSKENRLKIAQLALIKFLERKRLPQGLSSEQLAEEIGDLADALVRKIAARDDESFSEAVQQTIRNLRDTSDSLFWPTQAALVAAIPAQPASNAVQTTFTVDEAEHFLNRVNNNLPVSDHQIWGRLADTLIADGRVSEALIDNYRRGLIAQFIEVYRKDARRLAINRYGPRAIRFLDELGAYVPDDPLPIEGIAPKIEVSPPSETETSDEKEAESQVYRPYGGPPDPTTLEKSRAANPIIAAARADYARIQQN